MFTTFFCYVYIPSMIDSNVDHPGEVLNALTIELSTNIL